MYLILLVDILYWIVVITGLALALTWKRSIRERIGLGVASLLVLVLGLPVSGMLWPPDWLVPVKSVRASIPLNGFVLSYVQKPGSDFYVDTLEIKGADGRMAMVNLNVDNGKCWLGWAETSDNEIEFHCFPWGQMASINVTWLERNMERCKSDRCDLSVAYFAQQ